MRLGQVTGLLIDVKARLSVVRMWLTLVKARLVQGKVQLGLVKMWLDVVKTRLDLVKVC